MCVIVPQVCECSVCSGVHVLVCVYMVVNVRMHVHVYAGLVVYVYGHGSVGDGVYAHMNRCVWVDAHAC